MQETIAELKKLLSQHEKSLAKVEEWVKVRRQANQKVRQVLSQLERGELKEEKAVAWIGYLRLLFLRSDPPVTPPTT